MWFDIYIYILYVYIYMYTLSIYIYIHTSVQIVGNAMKCYNKPLFKVFCYHCHPETCWACNRGGDRIYIYIYTHIYIYIYIYIDTYVSTGI